MIINRLFKAFFEILVTVKLYHYQVESGFRHEKCDWFFERFIKHADDFLETMQGKYGRIQQSNSLNLVILSLNDRNVNRYMIEVGRFLEEVVPKYIKNDPELMNIRDELLGDVNQFRYFMKFD